MTWLQSRKIQKIAIRKNHYQEKGEINHFKLLLRELFGSIRFDLLNGKIRKGFKIVQKKRWGYHH
ncbi:hypothetical protein COY07_02265 [Candidatus Peregrinibacteria bacterium CG_4_10_14_0_2_um_filter_43_11]|nr:MAG: hypothetical protein COY07_02265 [Candidatus Peregrinibacteria bacterium CG_4_10_14_0_2_um_filter_43_11]